MATTFLQVRNMVRQRTDMSGSIGVSSGFITEPELGQYVNESAAEFAGLVRKNDVQFYLTSSVITVPAGSSSISRPTGMVELKGLDRSLDGSGNPGTWQKCHRLEWEERNNVNAFSNLFYTQDSGIFYLDYGTYFQLQPTNSAPGLYTLWYYPQPTTLVNDSDTIQDDQQYLYQFIVVSAALKVVAKDQDTELFQMLQAEKADLKQQVIDMTSVRDFGAPQVVGRHGYPGFGRGWPGANGGGWY